MNVNFIRGKVPSFPLFRVSTIKMKSLCTFGDSLWIGKWGLDQSWKISLNFTCEKCQTFPKKASFSRWGITTQLPGKTFRPGEEGPFLSPNFAKSFTCTTTKATSFSAASLFFPLEAPSLHPSLGGQTHFSKYRRERRQKKMETLSFRHP